MEVLLDTGFIMHCMRKRIDFLDQLEEAGLKVQVPREVLQELKDLKKEPYSSREDHAIINNALEMLSRKRVKHTSIGQLRKDFWLLKKGAMGYYIATTNSLIKRRMPKTIDILESKGRVQAHVGENEA
ncbi:MAG: PIN domain-containing protein [Nanoarchaeota archaeon]|nr:PIN domain-containing protein [Nanoarchaeota archaeon]